MDTASKATLKRDLFVQGLQLKWQEKVLPTAESFEVALFQARIAEEQARDLAYLHKQQYSNFRSNVEASTSKKNTGPGAKHFQSNAFGGACFSCGKVGHRQRDCPLTIPPPEATGLGKATNSVITATANSFRPQNSTEGQCAQLRLALADAEFQRMCQNYGSHTGDITTVTGALGPLFHATVSMEGIPIRRLVDSGSSATIISYNVFEKIGKAAKIPASELHQPNVILRDYSQRTIPVGASVNLTVSFQGHSVTVPVYIRPVDTSQCESCLLGTNVVIPLKLMAPHSGLMTDILPLPTNSLIPVQAPVHLIKAVRIPARTGIVVEGVVLLQSGSLNISSSLVQQPTNGKIYHIMLNKDGAIDDRQKHMKTLPH